MNKFLCCLILLQGLLFPLHLFAGEVPCSAVLSITPSEVELLADSSNGNLNQMLNSIERVSLDVVRRDGGIQAAFKRLGELLVPGQNLNLDLPGKALGARLRKVGNGKLTASEPILYLIVAWKQLMSAWNGTPEPELTQQTFNQGLDHLAHWLNDHQVVAKLELSTLAKEQLRTIGVRPFEFTYLRESFTQVVMGLETDNPWTLIFRRRSVSGLIRDSCLRVDLRPNVYGMRLRANAAHPATAAEENAFFEAAAIQLRAPRDEREVEFNNGEGLMWVGTLVTIPSTKIKLELKHGIPDLFAFLKDLKLDQIKNLDLDNVRLVFARPGDDSGLEYRLDLKSLITGEFRVRTLIETYPTVR